MNSQKPHQHTISLLSHAVVSLLKSPERVALVVALFFGIISAFLIPNMTINDEGAHLLKSYTLSNLSIENRHCTFPVDIINATRVPSDPHLYNDYAGSGVDHTRTEKTSCGSASNYMPIMHIPQAIGITVGKAFELPVGSLILLGRLANAIFYAVALYYIIKLARYVKWAYAAVGLFPIMIHTAGSLSADVVNNVIVLFAIAYFLNLFSQKTLISKRQIITTVLLSLLLAASKTTNIILLLPLVVLPCRLFRPNKVVKAPFNINKWFLLTLCGAAAVVIIGVWNILFGSMLFRPDTAPNPLSNNPAYFIYILYNTYLNSTLGIGDLIFRGVYGEFSSFRFHSPSILVFLGLATFFATTISSSKADKEEGVQDVAKAALPSFLTFTILFLAITLALYSAWALLNKRFGAGAIYADGVQGRYFTAALVVLIPIGIWLQKYIQLKFSNDHLLGCIVTSVSVIALTFYVAQIYLTFS